MVFIILSVAVIDYMPEQMRIYNIPERLFVSPEIRFQECLVDCIAKSRFDLPLKLDAASLEATKGNLCTGICLKQIGYDRSVKDGPDPKLDTSGNYCESDEECTCQGFTGGGFIPASSQSGCDIKESRCFQCGYM